MKRWRIIWRDFFGVLVFAATVSGCGASSPSFREVKEVSCGVADRVCTAVEAVCTAGGEE